MATYWLYPAAVLAGVAAGFINTLAGSGSLVTLPMLVALGLPAPVANGTNRIGVLIQNAVGIWKFRASGNLNTDHGGRLLLPSVLGALVGARIAVDLDEQTMRYAMAAVMALMLPLIIYNPKKWLRKESEAAPRVRDPLTFLAYFAVGVYGGFIQAGVGIFLLAALVMRSGFSMVHANALKLVIVLALSLPALAVFARHGQVHLGYGLLMAAGQGVGAWLAARFASENKHAAVWMHRLLLAVIVVGIVHLLR